MRHNNINNIICICPEIYSMDYINKYNVIMCTIVHCIWYYRSDNLKIIKKNSTFAPYIFSYVPIHFNVWMHTHIANKYRMYIIYILKVFYDTIQIFYTIMLLHIFRCSIFVFAAEIEKWQINKKYCLHCVTQVEYGYKKIINIKFSKNQKLQ